MKIRLYAGVIFGLIVLICAGVIFSRLNANRIADTTMHPLFLKGWFRKDTVLVILPDHAYSPAWTINYDNSGEMVDFGPQFIVTFLGKVISVSPSDLKAQIEKLSEAEQGAAANP